MAPSPPCARPRRRLSILAVLLAAAATADARTQHPGVTFGPPPDWVVTMPLGAPRPFDEVTQIDGLEHLLLDDQIRTGMGPREHFRRHVYRVLDEKGIRDASQIQIEFDPSYASVVIHGLVVYRGEREISRLSESGVRVVEREQGLEAHIYDERLSVLAILDDVRIGDRIETMYTIRGDNPVFDGRYAGRISLGWTVPVRHVTRRILFPKERRLNVKKYRSDADPAVIEVAGTKEFRWDLVDVPAVLPENEIPSWFDPFPAVEVSEYADWTEVGRWGRRQYENPATTSEELRGKIEEIVRLHPEADARIVTALAFVRDEIRYLSLALGPHSHRPSHPDTVLQRRFGDCKDKAALLVALLEGLGVRARPAFVNTQAGRHVADSLPSPLAFDHVIVQVEQGGRNHWIDPTPLHPRGTLDRLTCPRFGAALVLDDANPALVPIEPPEDDRPRSDIRTNIDASDPGGSARFSVETTYIWGAADSMRASLVERGSASLAKGYLDFYARDHPSIRADGPLEVRDDERDNVIVTTERYVVPDFWRMSEDGTREEASIHAGEISGLVSIPSTTARTMPLGIRHPVHVVCRTTAHLRGDWDVQPVRRRVETDAVRFKCDISSSGSVIHLDYHFETLQDSLPPEKALAHVEQLDRILDVTRYDLSQPDDSSQPASAEHGEAEIGSLYWTFLFFFVAMSFLITAIGSAALYFYRPKGPPNAVQPGDAHLQGIGGWLALVAIGIVFTPFGTLWNLIQMAPAFDEANWAALTTSGSDSYHALWAPVLLAELFVHIGMVVLSALLLVLFFQKRRSFPVLFVASRVAWSLFLILDSWVTTFLPDMGEAGTNPRLVGSLCAAWVWVLYFLKSRRVRATFVR